MLHTSRRIERLLVTLLADLSGILSSAERAEVVQFIDVGEYGVALETLAALIVEEGKRVPLSIFEQIVDLADSMGLQETIPTAALRSQVEAK